MTIQEHMPVVQFKVPGDGTDRRCDYSPALATWFHWADQHVDRDAFACNDHVHYLNRNYV